MARLEGTAQLVTSFDPVAPRARPTSLQQALVEWSELDEPHRAEALLIVYASDAGRPHVYGRAAISQLVAEVPLPPAA